MLYVSIAAIVFVLSGVLAMAGLGAAFLFVPIFYWLGVPLYVATSTALLLNVVSLSSASVTYWRAHLAAGGSLASSSIAEQDHGADAHHDAGYPEGRRLLVQEHHCHDRGERGRHTRDRRHPADGAASDRFGRHAERERHERGHAERGRERRHGRRIEEEHGQVDRQRETRRE